MQCISAKTCIRIKIPGHFPKYTLAFSLCNLPRNILCITKENFSKLHFCLSNQFKVSIQRHIHSVFEFLFQIQMVEFEFVHRNVKIISCAKFALSTRVGFNRLQTVSTLNTIIGSRMWNPLRTNKTHELNYPGIQTPPG